MNRRSPNRKQSVLIPELVEERIKRKPHAARFFCYIAMYLDLPIYKPKIMGTPAYHRPTLVALVLYAFFHGMFSAEDIHEFSQDNLGAIWILGTMGLPSEKTIERVIHEMLDQAESIFAKVFQLCDALGLVARERLFIDGKKSKANASKHKAMSYGRLCDKIEKAEEKISETKACLASTIEAFEDYTDEQLQEFISEQAKTLFKEKEAQHQKGLDQRQQAIFAGQNPEPITTTNSAVPLPFTELARTDLETLLDLGRMQFRLITMKNGKEQLEKEWKITHGNKPIPDTKQINFTDPESRIMVTKHQGVQQCYNHFVLVDDKASIISGVHTSNSASDQTSFLPTMNHAETVLGNFAGIIVGGDAGFFSAQNQLSAIEKGYTLWTPFPKPTDPFHKEKFVYKEDGDYYICPENNSLKPVAHRPKTVRVTYKTSDCLNCPSQKKCTKAKDGIRKIVRNREEDPIREQAKERAQSEEGKEVISQRKGVVEPVFGNMVTNDNLGQMHYRGLDKAGREFFLRCIVHNLRKAFKAFCKSGQSQRYIMEVAQSPPISA